jgi:REP element-mobilizing transposase RayT
MILYFEKYHRHSIRLKNYDYSSPGYYFVTICTYNRACLLSEIKNSKIILTPLGKMVKSTWNDLPNHNSHIQLDELIIMPNHVHGIIIIQDNESVGAGSEPAPTNDIKPTRHGLPEIIRQFKTFSARRINKKRQTMGYPVWQRNYYEHVIRGEKELYQIKNYIIDNPHKWELDKENPKYWKNV